VASIADARSFDNGRQVSAWQGLVPRQSSSGGKATLLGMSKRGDAYLRTLRRGVGGYLDSYLYETLGLVRLSRLGCIDSRAKA
jgi:hypothetical protein